MNKILKIVCLGLILIIVPDIVFSQQKSGIALISQAKKDKILLRWAPKDANSWEMANKYGYTLERYIILRDSAILSSPEKKVIGDFSPAPLQDWETKIDENDYIAVSAQAIYGETFELTEDYSNDIMQIVNKTKEQMQRFSFALFAADQSFEAAQLSGLGYIDTDVKENEKYLYKVFANIPEEILVLDSGLTYLSIADYAPLTPIDDVSITIAEGLATIKWNQAQYESIYNSFIVERSADAGASYQSVSKRPIINSFNGKTQSKYAIKTDSVADGKEYTYRVRGRTAFGEISPASKVVKGTSYSTAAININFSDVNILEGNRVQLAWEFKTEWEDQINGFHILRGGASDGDFTKINTEILGPDYRSYVDEEASLTNYYKVEVESENGVKRSFPYLVQLEDSIPPAVPKNIKYVIATSGEVFLSWDSNSEADFLGYRVYQSNFRNSEFAEITPSPITTNKFTTSISINNLTDSIYFRLKSVDNRYNASQFSAIRGIGKPDLIAPTQPLIQNFKVRGNIVEIEWQASSSSDVKKYKLYSRMEGESEWENVLIENASATKLDFKLQGEKEYELRITALDENNNESVSSRSIKVKAEQLLKEGVENLRYAIDNKDRSITLAWDYNQEDVIGYKIYKNSNESGFSLLSFISSDQMTFTDSKISFNEKLSYAILPLLNSKNIGTIKEIDIQF
ncbi:hypothetical protein SAMN05661096_00224 [Marivirga sericea]|uniref:Fibronectin type-III domain-containing protein n=1 Tax=Marivirga sericea TaxID=1028 RepID=A0A1X7I6J7_9BACT|nr:fibronectin type III domain-containing protein [Marivirga sericea]SMG09514.1 hypothetical protein SAMN05661096_00224 [Marivirga sericea]